MSSDECLLHAWVQSTVYNTIRALIDAYIGYQSGNGLTIAPWTKGLQFIAPIKQLLTQVWVTLEIQLWIGTMEVAVEILLLWQYVTVQQLSMMLVLEHEHLNNINKMRWYMPTEPTEHLQKFSRTKHQPSVNHERRFFKAIWCAV